MSKNFGARLTPRWNKQPPVAPRIDFTNPLAKGLVAAIHPGTWLDLISGTALTVGGSVKKVPTPYGVSAKSGGDPAPDYLQASLVVPIPLGAADSSLVVVVMNPATLSSSSVANYVAGTYSGGASTTSIMLNDSSHNWAVWAGDGSGTNQVTSSGEVLPEGLHVLVHTQKAGTHKLFRNGFLKNSGAGVNGNANTTFALCGLNDIATGNSSDRPVLLGLKYSRPLSDIEAQQISLNPWQVFKRVRRQLWETEAAFITRPNSDITVAAWTATPAGSLYDCLNEVSASDSDYITSPALSYGTPAVFGISPALAAGTYDIHLRGKFTATAGQVRVILQDSGGSAVGTSAWQALTGSFADYTLPVTTTGTATRARIETQ